MFMFFACSDDNPTDSTPVTSSDFEFSGDLRSFATVTFKSISQNADTYLWEFGDGTTSALANPTKVYETAGVYNVKLTAVSSTTGQKDIREKSITINPGKVYILPNISGITQRFVDKQVTHNETKMLITSAHPQGKFRLMRLL